MKKHNFEKDIDVPSKQIIIDGVDVNALYSDQIACMNRYEVADLFIKTVEQLKAKEQECEELKDKLRTKARGWANVNDQILKEVDQLKAEVKSKTEYIQEQRDIINQYSKEIEMYKKCQGKRASKREEELKAENEELKTGLKQIQKQFGIEILYCKTTGESTFRSTEILKLKQILTEIKEIAEKPITTIKHTERECYGDAEWSELRGKCALGRQILQKISEVEDV